MKTHYRHTAFYIAVLVALLSCMSAFWVAPLLVTIIASNSFFITYLALSAVRIQKLEAPRARGEISDSDVPIWGIFLIAFSAFSAALTALFIVINAGNSSPWIVALALSAVPLGWLTIHIMAAFHYAHLYWHVGSDGHIGKGLVFPGTKNPTGIDFLYFSLVIGMTAQTSDVEITSTRMRSMNIFHAVSSFFFNTVLVAAAVNAAVAIGN